jgi:hypothetical protein
MGKPVLKRRWLTRKRTWKSKGVTLSRRDVSDFVPKGPQDSARGLKPRVPNKKEYAPKWRQSGIIAQHMQNKIRITLSAALLWRVIMWIFPGVETPGSVLLSLRDKSDMSLRDKSKG